MSAANDVNAAPAADPRRALFANANFRWLLGGGFLSMLGDQFTLLALPWLVLQLSSDPLVLGTVLALASLPRAVFILIGGAIVDRYSSQAVLQLSKWANALLLGALAAMVASGTKYARAISAVVRPPNARSVSATWDGGDSAGWQHSSSSVRDSSCPAWSATSDASAVCCSAGTASATA